jgi:hypothetical protein
MGESYRLEIAGRREFANPSERARGVASLQLRESLADSDGESGRIPQ